MYETHPAEGDCRGVSKRSRRKLYMERMYEVLRFIEHGPLCRQCMDCVSGALLLDYLKVHSQMEKQTILTWFRQLSVCVDQYQRSGNGQNYRYLNPCSIVVSKEGELLLLDLESAGNEEAIKRMQKRGLRARFVKPVYEMGVSRNSEADLFSYGKTLQFILACTEVSPPLSGREERRLSRVIDRCTGASGKRYEDFTQVLKALPSVGTGRKNRSGRQWKRFLCAAAATGVCSLLCIVLALGRKGAAAGREQPETVNIVQEETSVREDVTEEETKIRSDTKEQRTDEEIIEDTLLAYGRLIEIEDEPGRIEQAGIKKMELEAEKGDYGRAVATGMQVLEKLESSEKISSLIEEYREKSKKSP